MIACRVASHSAHDSFDEYDGQRIDKQHGGILRQRSSGNENFDSSARLEMLHSALPQCDKRGADKRRLEGISFPEED